MPSRAHNKLVERIENLDKAPDDRHRVCNLDQG